MQSPHCEKNESQKKSQDRIKSCGVNRKSHKHAILVRKSQKEKKERTIFVRGLQKKCNFRQRIARKKLKIRHIMAT